MPRIKASLLRENEELYVALRELYTYRPSKVLYEHDERHAMRRGAMTTRLLRDVERDVEDRAAQALRRGRRREEELTDAFPVCFICDRIYDLPARGVSFIAVDGEQRWACDDAHACQWRALTGETTYRGTGIDDA